MNFGWQHVVMFNLDMLYVVHVAMQNPACIPTKLVSLLMLALY